jgi:hypothetical protein
VRVDDQEAFRQLRDGTREVTAPTLGLNAEMSARLQAGRLQRAGNASGAVILTALAGAIGLANAALGLFRP